MKAVPCIPTTVPYTTLRQRLPLQRLPLQRLPIQRLLLQRRNESHGMIVQIWGQRQAARLIGADGGQGQRPSACYRRNEATCSGCWRAAAVLAARTLGTATHNESAQQRVFRQRLRIALCSQKRPSRWDASHQRHRSLGLAGFKA